MVTALASAVNLGVIPGWEKLTESDVLEIAYKSDESFSDSSNDGISSSDNETDEAAVVDAVINDDSDEEEDVLYQ
jgi:hypothetical protein